MAILLALATFKSQLQRQKVVCFSDNVGAEKSTAKGRAAAWDHNCMVHQIWTLAFRHRVRLWIERVPSALNLADLPSRNSNRLLEELGGTFVEPVMHESLLEMCCLVSDSVPRA